MAVDPFDETRSRARLAEMVPPVPGRLLALLDPVPRTDAKHVRSMWGKTNAVQHPGKMRVTLAQDALARLLAMLPQAVGVASKDPLRVVDPMVGVATTYLALSNLEAGQAGNVPAAFANGAEFAGHDIDTTWSEACAALVRDIELFAFPSHRMGVQGTHMPARWNGIHSTAVGEDIISRGDWVFVSPAREDYELALAGNVGLVAFHDPVAREDEGYWRCTTPAVKHAGIPAMIVHGLRGEPYVRGFPVKDIDLIFTSPPFPNAHSQGKSAMQDRLRGTKSTFAGNNMGAKWPKHRAGWQLKFVEVMRPWAVNLKPGGLVAVHVRRHIEKGEVVPVDQWVSEALTEMGTDATTGSPKFLRLVGTLAAPLAYASHYREWAKYPLRAIDPDNPELLVCGGKTKPDGGLRKQRCTHCPSLKVPDVAWEFIVVAERI